MNIKWILVLLCLVLFIVVSEAKKSEGKGKDVQKDKYEKSQKGKSSEEFSKSEKVDKKTKVKKSAKNSKSADSAHKAKAVSDQKRDGKRQKREATESTIGTNEKPVESAKTLEGKAQKQLKSKKLSKKENSQTHAADIAESPTDSLNPTKANEESSVPVEEVQEKNVKPEKSKKVSKKQKREVSPLDASAPVINPDLEEPSFQHAAEKDKPLENHQSKSQVKKEKKKKQIEKTDAQETPEIDIVSVVEEV